jgi:hypothetical protein
MYLPVDPGLATSWYDLWIQQFEGLLRYVDGRGNLRAESFSAQFEGVLTLLPLLTS